MIVKDAKAARAAMEREKELVIRDRRRKKRPIFYSRLKLTRKFVAEIETEYRWPSILRRKRNPIKLLQGGTHSM